MKGMDLARRAFASMTSTKEGADGKEESTTGKNPPPDSKSAAERKFKSAIESGTGIASAFKTMMAECGDYDDDSGDDE
jgi:hypothetical protein